MEASASKNSSPLFVASTTSRRLLRLTAAWLLAVGLVLAYTLDRQEVLEVLAFLAVALAVAASAVALTRQEPSTYQFFDEFIRVTYPSSFWRIKTARIPYSSIEDFGRVKESDSTKYEFSIKHHPGKFMVKGVTSLKGGDLAPWMEAKISSGKGK